MDRLSFAGAIPVASEGDVQERRTTKYSRALQDRMGWLIAAGVVGAVIGGAMALSRPQEYRAEALIQVGGRDAALRSVAPGAQQTGQAFDASILKSRAVAGPVIERLHLDITAQPVRAPLLGGVVQRFSVPGKARGVWPEALGYAWGGERAEITSLAVPERLLNVPLEMDVLRDGAYRLSADDEMLLEGKVGEPVSGNGVEMFVTHIDARPGTRFMVSRHDPVSTVDTVTGQLRVDDQVGGAGTVRLAWHNPDRKLAAALVNGVADAYINGQTAQRRDDAAGSLQFLLGELPRVQAELERAETALTRYRSKSGSIAPTQDVQSYLHGSMEYQRQIAALRLERMKLLQRFTTDANEVKTVDGQIAEMIRERRDMDARMQNLSMGERESVALTRDVKVAEDMYMTLRNKIEQLSLIQSDRSSQARVVDMAEASTTPSGVGPWPASVAGAMLGMCLAAGSIVLRRRMKPVVADANEAEERLGMAMLGDIAYSDEQVELERQAELNRRFGMAGMLGRRDEPRLVAPQPGTAVAEPLSDAEGDLLAAHARPGLHDRFLLARRSPHAMAVEGLRSVRASLHFGLRGAQDNVVAITSPAPGAGKTFTAVNLAVLFAEAGQRVLLIDGDLRRGKVATWFDQPEEPGLSEVLAGRVQLAAAIQPTVVAGLSLLTAGRMPVNPSELLMLPTLNECLRLSKQRFDLVIVDTPPVLSVCDAMLVAGLAGSTLMVMRADQTLPSQVDDALKRLSRANARVAGGLINGVAQRRSNRAEFNTVNPYLGMPLPAASRSTLRLERRIGGTNHKAT